MTLRLFRHAALQRRLLQDALLIQTTGNKASVYTLDKIGNRDIVGHGWNGQYCYADRVDYPFPAIRFQEPTNEIQSLREKECASWKKLSVEEKKLLYRYSFCQTFAEMKAPTGRWKVNIAHCIFACTLGYIFILLAHSFVTNEMPVTFDEERRKAQLKRMIALEVNPVQGLASKWDYENNRWK